MAIGYQRLKQRAFAPVRQHYGERDTALYALSLGLGSDLGAGKRDCTVSVQLDGDAPVTAQWDAESEQWVVQAASSSRAASCLYEPGVGPSHRPAAAHSLGRGQDGEVPYAL